MQNDDCKGRKRRWYAFRVVANREFRVQDRLCDLGYHAFLPVEQREKRIGRHGRRVATFPLLPGYVFLGFAGRVPWRDLREVDGLLSPLTTAGIPSRITEDEMDALFEVSGRLVKPPAPHQLREGDRAKVKTGAFAGFIVQIEAIARRRARVAVEMFGSYSSVQMPIGILQAA